MRYWLLIFAVLLGACAPAYAQTPVATPVPVPTVVPAGTPPPQIRKFQDGPVVCYYAATGWGSLFCIDIRIGDEMTARAGAKARLGPGRNLGGITPPVPSVSGQPMPATPPEGWTRIFEEDFDVPAAVGQFRSIYGSKFANYNDGWPTTGAPANVRRCSSKVVSVESGRMVYTQHAETLAADDPCREGSTNPTWLNAVEQPIPNDGIMGKSNARWTIRFRVVAETAALEGQYLVPLLWPVTEAWPADGEIDFPEGGLSGNMVGFIHHQGATEPGDQTQVNTGVPFTPGWHTATTEWIGGTSVKLYLDGALVGEVTERVPNKAMRYVLQTETCWGGPCPPEGSSVRIEWDWVVGETQ